ncbi:DoxX family protein [Sanguibacter suaedae]|uniref:DoxX family protein n=1 Tax=Sanguibacter suaedae TaxID=2795737 RepID=A0A934MC06_9MICO|nr:DoxX family protein [Sanguibacter suaedae]MBI9113429.1 DoxX family protein [Sanguibacter suaedae]
MHTLLHPARTTPVLADIALLVTRVLLGVVLIAHGWQKFNEYTIDGTTESFDGMGIPAPAAAAVFATFVELVGGIALVIGLLTPVFAALATLNFIGAIVFVHAGNGIFVDQGGSELVLALIAGLVILIALGAGRISVDHLITRRSRTA